MEISTIRLLRPHDSWLHPRDDMAIPETTTFRSSSDMGTDVNAPSMFPLIKIARSNGALCKFARAASFQAGSFESGFLKEARTDTGRLHSAGSRSPALPRRQRYYAALRLPRPLRPPLRFPLRATCHDTDASSWPPRARVRERTARRRLVFGSPYTCPVYCRGKTGVSQVTWPSSSSAPRSTTPPGRARYRPTLVRR